MKNTKLVHKDALIIGGGIAGLQTALDIAGQGYEVAVVEKNPSIGGNMIRLSKVFPTLDCASCITTPKMAAAAHHENIELFTYCELQSLDRSGDVFSAAVVQKPRFVHPDTCIGCRKCEMHCPVMVPDPEQADLVAKKAISIPFTNAIPQIAYLDPTACMLCGQCAQVCPKEAIDYFQEPEAIEIVASSVVAATGFQLMSHKDKPQYGNGQLPNAIDALHMERLLAPHGPYNRVLRPSDGKEPESVAFVQCAGSRDRSLGVPYCSRVCCMYAIKQAMLLAGSLPLADLTIYFMDIRAFGKGFEEFYQNAKAMGIEFVQGKVSQLTPGEDQAVRVHFEDQAAGQVIHREHDLVVLSMGIVPEWIPKGQTSLLSCGQDGFLDVPQFNLDAEGTAVPGLYVAGAASGPKDIPDTVAEAGAAAMKAANALKSRASIQSELAEATP